MDWHFAILLVAIAATWLAWRRARRQAELERAQVDAAGEPRWRYRLVEVPPGAGLGGGYAVETLDGARLDDERLEWARHGIGTIRIDDPEPFATMPAGAFEAGAGVRLVPDRQPDGAVLVEVRDEAGVVRLTSLSGATAEIVADLVGTGQLTDCIVLREAARDGGPVSLRLLIVHRDADVEA